MAAYERRRTFNNFRPAIQPPEALYELGKTKTYQGVLPDMAGTFGVALSPELPIDQVRGLIGVTGKQAELQKNIAQVQAALGTGQDAATVARQWVYRSGVLTPVGRSYMTGEFYTNDADIAVTYGGVGRWMLRRQRVIARLHRAHGLAKALLLGGNRVIGETELNPELAVKYAGRTEAEFLEEYVAQHLRQLGVAAHVVAVDAKDGSEVLQRGLAAASNKDIIGPSMKVAVAANAGVWQQIGGQYRQAGIAVFGQGYDQSGDQVAVVSDHITLGTGNELASVAQNPFSAVGLIWRGVLAMRQQYPPDQTAY